MPLKVIGFPVGWLPILSLALLYSTHHTIRIYYIMARTLLSLLSVALLLIAGAQAQFQFFEQMFSGMSSIPQLNSFICSPRTQHTHRLIPIQDNNSNTITNRRTSPAIQSGISSNTKMVATPLHHHNLLPASKLTPKQPTATTTSVQTH